MSTLNAVSILLSIGVIASKSWVVAYSSHAPTMAFNALCIVADVLSLFASIAWLFALPPKLHELASSLRGFLLLFVGLAVCSGALFFLLFCARRSAPLEPQSPQLARESAPLPSLLPGAFVIFDEVLHRRRRQRGAWMPPALVPLVFSLCLVPVTVLYLMCRWTLLALSLGTLGTVEPTNEKEHRRLVDALLAYVDGEPHPALPKSPHSLAATALASALDAERGGAPCRRPEASAPPDPTPLAPQMC